MFDREKFVSGRRCRRYGRCVQVARGRINLPEIANSFQHSPKEDRKTVGTEGGKGIFSFGSTGPPHSAPFPSSSSPASCSLSVSPAFLPIFLAPASRAQVSVVSISAYTPAARLCFYLVPLSFPKNASARRRETRRYARGRNSAWSCSPLEVKFKPHH